MLQLARLLPGAGQRLSGGDRIVTGSLTHVPAHAGQRVTAGIEGMGLVEVALHG